MRRSFSDPAVVITSFPGVTTFDHKGASVNSSSLSVVKLGHYPKTKAKELILNTSTEEDIS